MKPNRMKAKLLAGEPTLGVSIMIPSAQMVEIIGALGFDWVLIDCEHGTISLETVEAMVMAAEASGITPIARPTTKRPEDIMQLMDRGAMGVQVPHVNTAEDAREAVAAVKFHPRGHRGLAAGTRAGGYDLSGSAAEYVQTANRETLVCIQLEEQQAIENVEELLQVEDVDVFFVGPSDLSQSMGYPGNPKAEPVRRAIEATFAKIVSAGKIPGTPATADTIRGILDKGVRYVYTHIPKLLGNAAAGYFAAARPPR